MKAVPIMLMSDAPELQTGLARITRDLALGLSKMPEYRVSTFGRGGRGSRYFPWVQYVYPQEAQWGESYIEECWDNFTGGEPGILFTIWDATRLPWLVFHDNLSDRMKRFFNRAKMQRWGYFPVDAVGPNDGMSALSAMTIGAFDKVLAYGMFGQEVIQRATGRTDVSWIPHGVNLDLFRPHDRDVGRILLNLKTEDTIVGCVMTNQHRKDWGLAFRIMAEVIRERPDVKFWAHTDVLSRTWSFDALIADYNMAEHTRVTLSGEYNDRALATLYSTCKLTILPSLGEGFGYPIVESLGCGVPVLHGNYAGGAELVDPAHLIPSRCFRIDTPYNLMRPVFEPSDWTGPILRMLEDDTSPEEYRRRVDHLNWPNLWPVWEKWFREALG